MQCHGEAVGKFSLITTYVDDFSRRRNRGKSERIWSHLPNMHALESEVEHACSEEDPASDKQLSKYE